MDFRCGAGANLSIDEEYRYFPCQNGGPCIDIPGFGEACATCEKGWEHDLYGFAHFYNCAMPSWAPLTFLIIHTIILVLGLCLVASLFMRNEVKRGKTRTVTLINAVCAVLAWLSVLLAYVQRGVFEGSLVSLMCLASLGFSISPFIVPGLLSPIASATNNLPTLRRSMLLFRCVSAVQITFMCGLMIAAVVRCRDVDKRTFNLIMIIVMWDVVAAVAVQAIITLAVCHRLGRFFVDFDKRSANSNNSPPDAVAPPSPSALSPFMRMGSVAEQRHRMILSQLCVIATFCGICLASSLIMNTPLVLWTVHHSLPYMWIFHIVAFPVLALSFPLIVPFVRGAAAARSLNRLGLSSSGERHFISEGADYVDENGAPIRGLGIKKSKRNPLWRIRLANVLSRISEESQIGSKQNKTLISKMSVGEHQAE
jgi:hypothetical protein